MLKDLLKEYASVKIISVVSNNNNSEKNTNQILNKIAKYINGNEGELSPSSVDKYIAMMAFYEMFEREIGGDMSDCFCYYYSTLVIQDKSLPATQRVEGNKFRAFILVNSDFMERIISMSQSRFNGYNGNLKDKSFFDILLLSDLYKAWDSDPSSPLLLALQRQAPNVAAKYPELSREQILNEGEIAHKAVFRTIKSIVEKRFFKS